MGLRAVDHAELQFRLHMGLCDGRHMAEFRRL